MMTTLEAIGLVASIIAIFESGYAIGTWRTNKRRKSAEDELIANRLRQLLGSVRVKKVECNSKDLFTGQTIPMSLVVASDANCALEAWIGASLLSQSGSEYYDLSQDKPVMLEPGTKTYHRSLTIPVDVPSGEYSLYCAVWLGQVANPERSIKLHKLNRNGKLKIHKR